MFDGYTHLDMTVPDPVADLRERMTAAGVTRALIVETWSADNLHCLERLEEERSPDFRIGRCFRPQQAESAHDLFKSHRVHALRVKTADMLDLGPIADLLGHAEPWLLPHAESGIQPLTDALLALTRLHPHLNVYLPHLGWPVHNKHEDRLWKRSIVALSELQNIVVGVSALSHFSCEAYPHRDLERYTDFLRETFPEERLVPGSDYPLFEKTKYTEYMHLAAAWSQSGQAPSQSHLERSLFEPQKGLL